MTRTTNVLDYVERRAEAFLQLLRDRGVELVTLGESNRGAVDVVRSTVLEMICQAYVDGYAGCKAADRQDTSTTDLLRAQLEQQVRIADAVGAVAAQLAALVGDVRAFVEVGEADRKGRGGGDQ